MYFIGYLSRVSFLLYLFSGHLLNAVIEIGDKAVYFIPGLGLHPSAEAEGDQVQSGIYAVQGHYQSAYGGGKAFHQYCMNLL